jgi:hypothetical protein
LRTLFNPSRVDIYFTSIPGVRFATPGYRLPTLQVEDVCPHKVEVTNKQSGHLKVVFP